MMTERKPGIRPRPSLGRSLDVAARYSFPGVSTALLMLVVAGPLWLPGQAELQGALALGCVFYWSLFRPLSMPPQLVFALGMLADLLGFGPIGIELLILLITHGLAMLWRRELARQGFLLVWLVFVAVAAGAGVLQWALNALLTFRLLAPEPVMFQATLAAGIYPLLAVALGRAHTTIAEPARA